MQADSTASDFHIQGDTTSLSSLILWKKKWIPSLKRCRALFLDQFITQGNFLMEYYDLSLKANNPNREAIPGWFIAIQKTVLLNPLHSNCLKPEYCMDNFTPQCFIIASTSDSDKKSP